MNYGEAFKQVAYEQGLSVSEIADSLGVSVQNVYQQMRQKSAQLRIIKQHAEILGVSAAHLVARANDLK